MLLDTVEMLAIIDALRYNYFEVVGRIVHLVLLKWQYTNIIGNFQTISNINTVLLCKIILESE